MKKRSETIMLIFLQGTCNIVVDGGKYVGYDVPPTRIPADRMQGAVREVARICPELRQKNKILDRCQPAFWPIEFIIRSTINTRRSSASRAERKNKKKRAAVNSADESIKKSRNVSPVHVSQQGKAMGSDAPTGETPTDTGSCTPLRENDWMVPPTGPTQETTTVALPVAESAIRDDLLEDEPAPVDDVDSLYKDMSSEDHAFASSLLFAGEDPVDEPSETDVQNGVFTLFMPEQSRVKVGNWDSHSNAVAKCHVLPPGGKVYGHQAPKGYRVVNLTALSQHPGMGNVLVPALDMYKGGNVDEIRGGGLQARFDSGARLFLWPKDMIYRTRKDGSLTPGGSIKWVVSPVTDSDLPRDPRKVASRSRRGVRN